MCSSDLGSAFEVSDSNLGIKAIQQAEGAPVEIGKTWYRNGEFSA